MKIRSVTLFLSLIIIYSCGQNNQQEAQENAVLHEVTVQEVCAMINANPGLLFLDVRSPGEYSGNLGHLKNALLIPVNELESRLSEIESYKNSDVVVYCRSGSRSARAGGLLASQGFTSVSNMLRGMRGWNSASVDDLPCKELLLEN